MHIYMYTHNHIYIYMYCIIHIIDKSLRSICTYINVCVYSYIYNMYMYKYIYICLFAYIHIYMYIYIYMSTIINIFQIYIYIILQLYYWLLSRKRIPLTGRWSDSQSRLLPPAGVHFFRYPVFGIGWWMPCVGHQHRDCAFFWPFARTERAVNINSW
jgi:hypothetical protein